METSQIGDLFTVPSWKGDVSFSWSLHLLPRQKRKQWLLPHWAVCRWKLALAEDGWDWTPGVIASTSCSVTMDIYLLSSVCYSPMCYASLNFVCNPTDHFSLSCFSRFCESLCLMSQACDLIIVLAASHKEEGLQSGVLWKKVCIHCSPWVWGGSETSHLGKCPRCCRERREILLQ